MNYKNGREALEGDSVVGEAWIEKGDRIVAGTVQRLIPDENAPLCILSVPVLGGKPVSLEVAPEKLIHADDAWASSLPKTEEPEKEGATSADEPKP